MSGFSWNFQDMLTMTQGTLWYISGMIGLTPWTQGSFFYFLDPCLWATSRNTGWMDFHEIFRILTQKAIGYTVSRLSRLLHALQTRRGGGLRSRSASCYACYANWLIAAFISCQKLLLPFFYTGYLAIVFTPCVRAPKVLRPQAASHQTSEWKNRFAQIRRCADSNKHKAVLFP